MNDVDLQYLDLLRDVFQNGVEKSDRTGVGTKSVFGRQIRVNLEEGFPLLTTKKVHFKSVVHELLWFLKGSTNTKYLRDNGVTIWDEWADESGNLGPIYGAQWRNWGKDQILSTIDKIVNDPDSRRIVVSAWNVAELDLMKLQPCHMCFQFTTHKNKLNCHFLMRSVDVFLGLPFNIASYALLTHMIAKVCGLNVGEVLWTGVDVHLYKNHFEQVETQLSRSPYKLPTLNLNNVCHIDDFKFDDIKIVDYISHPSIKAPIAI